LTNEKEAPELLKIRGNENKTEEKIMVKAGIFSWPVPAENPIVFIRRNWKRNKNGSFRP